MESKTLTKTVELTSSSALERSALALDEALKIAKLTNDAKIALEAANGWIALAVLLDPETDQETKSRIGFYHDNETG